MKLSKYNLIKITLILFLTIFIISYNIEKNYSLKLTKIQEITLNDLDKTVKIIANIKKQIVNKENNISIIKIYDNSGEITAIIFNYYNNNKLIKNKKYEFIGKISIYNQKPEIIIKKILKNN